MTEKEEMLFNVQKYRFALIDIAMYLDSHKNDKEAMETFKKYGKDYLEAKKAYVDKFGPLMHSDLIGESKWTWTDAPWPWEV